MLIIKEYMFKIFKLFILHKKTAPPIGPAGAVGAGA
jgi:hypothetical protein